MSVVVFPSGRPGDPLSKGGESKVLGEVRGRVARMADDLALLRWRLGGIAALIVVTALIIFISRQGQYVPSPADVDAARARLPVTTTTVPSTTSTTLEIVVDAGGAVVHPGLYRLNAGARVADVIDAAGGTTPDADKDVLNLAERLTDGQRIYVVKIGQTLPPDVVAMTSSGSGSSAPTVVDVNSATAQQLESLPGVGPATAQAIISYRSEHGHFASIEDLALVKGIGPAKLGQLKDFARV